MTLTQLTIINNCYSVGKTKEDQYMKRITRLYSLVVAAVIMLGALLPAPITAAASTPVTGFTYNNSRGSRAEQYAIVNYIQSGIDNAPKGSYIRIALYSAGIPEFTQSIVNAHKRGVNVRVVVSGHSSGWNYYTALKNELGTDNKQKSFVMVCALGCFSTTPGSSPHAKIYTFSQTGSAKNVTMITSSNPTSAQAEKGFNNLYTIVGDSGMYNAQISYVEAMAKSAPVADNIDYYRSITSGIYTSVQSPSIKDRAYYYNQVFDNISCKAAKGYGYNGRTTVRIGMAGWSGSRLSYAKKIHNLAEKGCRVEAIISAHGTDEDVQKELLRPVRGGSISVRNMSKDINGDGQIDQYLHDKAVAVSGGYNGRQSKIVWTGSHNFTYSAFKTNNDVILKINSASAWSSYVNHFNDLKAYAPIMKYVVPGKEDDGARTNQTYQGMSRVETTPAVDPESPEYMLFPEEE